MRNYSPRELREMPVSEFLAVETAERLQAPLAPFDFSQRLTVFPECPRPFFHHPRTEAESSDLLAYEAGGFAPDE